MSKVHRIQYTEAQLVFISPQYIGKYFVICGELLGEYKLTSVKSVTACQCMNII